MAGKMTHKVTIMVDDETREIVFDITSANPDINTSEVYRSAILDCADKFKRRPALIKMLPTIKPETNQI